MRIEGVGACQVYGKFQEGEVGKGEDGVMHPTDKEVVSKPDSNRGPIFESA